MPEKPEVITVAKKLKNKLLDRKIKSVKVFYPTMIEYPTVEEFKKGVSGQEIHDITTRGKWIVLTLDESYLLFHLRMEGKFFFRTKDDEINKHEHVIFTLDDDTELRFADVRKFAKIMLIPKDKIFTMKPYTELGLEPWDKNLTPAYLKNKFENKKCLLKRHFLTKL